MASIFENKFSLGQWPNWLFANRQKSWFLAILALALLQEIPQYLTSKTSKEPFQNFLRFWKPDHLWSRQKLKVLISKWCPYTISSISHHFTTISDFFLVVYPRSNLIQRNLVLHIFQKCSLNIDFIFRIINFYS